MNIFGGYLDFVDLFLRSRSRKGVFFFKVANHVVSMIGSTDFLNQSNHS